MAKVTPVTEQKPAVKAAKEKINYITTVGRRKESVARIRLTPGLGQVVVNGKPGEDYFIGLINKQLLVKPFALTSSIKQYGATVLVTGGGMSAQLDAVVHGIARALSKADVVNFRPVLKSAGLLTRDPRAKERRKYGLAGKARAKKQSPKR